MLTRFLRCSTPWALAVVAFSLAGCGSDSPMSSTTQSEPAGVAYLAFDPAAVDRVAAPVQSAAKSLAIPDEGLTVSRLFRPRRAGSMHVADLEGRGVRDDLVVTFGVGRRGLSQAARITMTAFGNKLSELVLAFEPHGLVFDNPATITVKIGAERVDRSLLDLQGLVFPFADVAADHEHDDTVEAARVISVRTFVRLPLLGDVETYDLLLYDYAEIKIECPGFSRYGLRKGGGY